jgi:two-component system cell cycle response regulator DivK
MSGSVSQGPVASRRAEQLDALILVVEDNERNARLTVAMLAAAGYRTCVAVDGIEGRQLAADLQPSLIVTDLQMPRLDGLAMTRALKGDPQTRQIPVIAVSAHALNEHRENAFAAGCVQFLAKPLRLQELLNEVANAIGCQHSNT